jgi:hypothetical protein
MRNVVTFDGEKAVFARKMHRTYAKLVEDGREQFGKSEDWKIERIRAEEDKIIVECAEGADQSWFTEKTCLTLRLSEDGIYQAATRVPPGMWGKASPVNPTAMITRARAAAASKKKRLQVILQLLPEGQAFNIGEASEYDQALDLARKSGKVPKGWTIAVSESNEESIIVIGKDGTIQANDRLAPKAKPAVRPSKPKAKKVDLPEKLVGKNPEQVFLSKAPIPQVPGKIAEELDQRQFRIIPRPIDQLMGSWTIKVRV